MSIAVFTPPSPFSPRLAPVLAPFQALARWFVSSAAVPRHAGRTGRATGFKSREAAINPVAAYAPPPVITAGLGSQIRVPDRIQKPRPSTLPAVRMVRVLEAGQAPASVGRMVISGRMADVCAELDRLALREAALH